MKAIEGKPGSIFQDLNTLGNSVGYSFKTKKAGIITELGVSAVEADTYLISLYEGVSSQLLASTEIVITDAQITANPYGFHFSALTEGVPAKANQLFSVMFTKSSGNKITHTTQISRLPFRMLNSFIEFQSGVYGILNGPPAHETGGLYFTADIKIKYN